MIPGLRRGRLCAVAGGPGASAGRRPAALASKGGDPAGRSGRAGHAGGARRSDVAVALDPRLRARVCTKLGNPLYFKGLRDDCRLVASLAKPLESQDFASEGIEICTLPSACAGAGSARACLASAGGRVARDGAQDQPYGGGRSAEGTELQPASQSQDPALRQAQEATITPIAMHNSPIWATR